MIKIKQLISYILVIQLCVSCTGSGGGSSPLVDSSSSSDGSSEGGTVTIEGQISKVFRGVSDLLISSAAAQEGVITVYDITDPDDPRPIGESYPVESEAKGYSIKLPADQAVGAILKLKYKGPVGERDLLLSIDDAGSPIDGEMNEEKHFEATILEEQLKQEVGDFSEKKEEFRDRFKELKKSGVSEDLALFGDSESMKEILMDGDNGPKMKKLIIESRKAREKGDSESESAIVSSMVDLAKELFGDSYSSKNQLNCLENKANFFIDGKKMYSFSLIGNDLEVLRAFRGVADFGVASTSEEANQILREMTLKLQGISKENKDKNVSGVVTISDVSEGEEKDADKTCTLKAFKGEIEAPDYFYNLKLIQDIQFADAANQDELSQKLRETFKISFEEYQNDLTKKISQDDDLFTIVLKLEERKASELIEKRIKEYVESSSGAFNPSFMRDIDFDQFSTYAQGSQALEDAFKKTIENLGVKDAVVDAPLALEERTVDDVAAKMKESFIDVKSTMTEAAYVEDSLSQEELAREYFLNRLDDLRKYFSAKYKANYAYNTELINSIDLEKLSLDEGVQRLMEGMKLSIHDVQTKIDQKGGVESLAVSEILFFQIRDISSQLESRLIEFQGYLHPGSSYMIDRTSISSLSYHNFSSVEFAYQEAEVARSRAMDALKERFLSEGGTEEDLNVLYREQKILSEVTLHVTRLESNICFQGEGGSLLLVCRNERELVARRSEAEAATRTKSLSEKLQAAEF